MIVLTDQQRQSLQEGRAVRVRENGQEFVLLTPDVFERLTEGADDSDSWTAAEMDLVREESLEHLDRFGMKP